MHNQYPIRYMLYKRSDSQQNKTHFNIFKSRQTAQFTNSLFYIYNETYGEGLLRVICKCNESHYAAFK